MRYFLLVLLLVFAAGCTTTESKNEERWEKLPDEFPIPPPKKSRPTSDKANEPIRIDLESLQSKLGMNRQPHTLGFREKEFNTCNVGSGFSDTHDCHTENFVVIHFQLTCRDSDGTVSEVVTAADTMAISNQSIKWNLGKISGVTKTDREGFAQIRTTAPFSQKESRLRITSDSDFLYLRAGDISRVVTPKQWCR